MRDSRARERSECCALVSAHTTSRRWAWRASDASQCGSSRPTLWMDNFKKDWQFSRAVLSKRHALPHPHLIIMADFLKQIRPRVKNRKQLVEMLVIRKHMWHHEDADCRPETTRARLLPRISACVFPFGSPVECRKCGSVVNGRFRRREKNRSPREFQSDFFPWRKGETA